MTKRKKYYHVRITPKSNPYATETILDLTPEELDRQFVIPHKQGNAIVINGKTISVHDLDRIQIHETNGDSSQVASDLEGFELEMGYIQPYDEVTYSALRLAQQGEDVTNKYIFEAPVQAAAPRGQQANQARPAPDTREVFVVHGRNEKARAGLFDFLRAINLRPLEWSDALELTGKGSPYVGEALDAAFSHAHAVVVLFTPDDEVRLKSAYRNDSDGDDEIELSGQARPNVLFESGMALGRDENRTILVELGELRPFSDTLGRHTVRPSTDDDWRRDLANRLKTAGCPVDLGQRDWETAGDLETALDAEAGASRNVDENTTRSGLSPLSDGAKELLLASANKDDRMIVVLRVGDEAVIRNGNGTRTIADAPDAMAIAKLEAEIEELVSTGLVKRYEGSGEAYEVSYQGFLTAKSLGKSIE